MEGFVFARLPRVVFGAGAIGRVGGIAAEYGRRLLLVTGRSSLSVSGTLANLTESLERVDIETVSVTVSGEPSPELVDETVSRHRYSGIGAVCAVGGGSVIDTGKAVAAMLTVGGPVERFLDGVGTEEFHPGTTLPFIAVPTTAGTGSEATKNAVLSWVGPKGFKKSLRHDNFTPTVAVVDPELTISCPPDITATSGMDALSQLIESYVSTKASPLTDALAISGIERAARSLVPVCTYAGIDIAARSDMAYAALVSGMTLANAGLCVVHGLASAVGGKFPAPHGVVCGTILASWAETTVGALRAENNTVALGKFARIGKILSGKYGISDHDSCDALIDTLSGWTADLKIPRLGTYGVAETDIPALAHESGNKNNPVRLTQEDIIRIVLRRL